MLVMGWWHTVCLPGSEHSHVSHLLLKADLLRGAQRRGGITSIKIIAIPGCVIETLSTLPTNQTSLDATQMRSKDTQGPTVRVERLGCVEIVSFLKLYLLICMCV